MTGIRFALRRVVAVVFASAVLAGCTSVRRQPLPSVALPSRWTMSDALGATGRSDSPAAADFPADSAAVSSRTSDWWTSFGDPVLDRLIAEGLSANNDLAVAAIRVRRAQLRARLAGTNVTPSVSVSGSASHALGPHATSRTSGGPASLSYELDLWGNLAAKRDAAIWEANASVADREATRLSLIGTVARLYWRAGYLSEQLALSEASLAYTERIVALVRARYAAGEVSGLDVAQAEQSMSAQRVARDQLGQQRAENRHALAILFDQPPEGAVVEPAVLPNRPLPVVSAGLPADLLGRRPDLRAAELRLREALAGVDIARTSFYPTFTLTGTAGTASTGLAGVLSNPAATLGLGVTLPFLEWNTMRLKLKVSQSEFEEAVVMFRKKLYAALAEVEDALSARMQLEREREERVLALALARRAQALARVRFESSTTDLQPWLVQQQALLDAQRAELDNRLGRLENRVKLLMALGGGQS